MYLPNNFTAGRVVHKERYNLARGLGCGRGWEVWIKLTFLARPWHCVRQSKTILDYYGVPWTFYLLLYIVVVIKGHNKCLCQRYSELLRCVHQYRLYSHGGRCHLFTRIIIVAARAVAQNVRVHKLYACACRLHPSFSMCMHGMAAQRGGHTCRTNASG